MVRIVIHGLLNHERNRFMIEIIFPIAKSIFELEKKMLKTILSTAVILAAPISTVQAQTLNLLPDIEDSVNQGMASEMEDIILGLPGEGPDLTCICYQTCEVLAAIARGDFPNAAAEEAALAAAMLADKTGGMISAIRNGGKLDMERMGKVTFKMRYAKGYDGKATAKLLARTGKVILK